MSTAVMWSKSKPEVEFQYGGRLGKFNGMSSQSHMPQCRVKEFVFRRILFYFFVFLMQFGLWQAAVFVSSSIHLFMMLLLWQSHCVRPVHLLSVEERQKVFV